MDAETDQMDWAKEPDMESLTRAHSLLASDPGQALTELKALADRGSVMSMLYIANAYRNGVGSGTDLQQAEEWYRRAMDRGSVLGSYELGRVYYEMENYPKAEKAFRAGESQNYAPSINMLGMMHLGGTGVEQNTGKARDLLERASALGHIFAKRNLAFLLITGRYGLREFLRGVGLFLLTIKDIFVVVPKNRFDSRLR
jgi:uncharacterized protein